MNEKKKPTPLPLLPIIGIVVLAAGLGTRLWAVAFVGAVCLGIWLLKRYPPRSTPPLD